VDEAAEAEDELVDSKRPLASAVQLRSELRAHGAPPQSNLLATFFAQEGDLAGANATVLVSSADASESGSHNVEQAGRAQGIGGTVAIGTEGKSKGRKRKALSLAECKERALAAALQKRKIKRMRK
jgi:hypothetical protein